MAPRKKSTNRQLLLSIRPRFARAIFDGTKSVELRRIKPRLSAGDRVVVYESSPTCAVVGNLTVEQVRSATPATLWREVGGISGLTRSEFLRYFEDVSTGYAILIGGKKRLRQAVPLSILRQAVPGFRPPQSFHYLRADRPRDRLLELSIRCAA